MSTENYIPHARTLSSRGTPLHASAPFDVREVRYGAQRCERFEVWARSDASLVQLAPDNAINISSGREVHVDLVSYQRSKNGGDWKEVCRGGYGGAQPFNNADEAIKEANRAFEAHVTQGRPSHVAKASSVTEFWDKVEVNAATYVGVRQAVQASREISAQKLAKLTAQSQLNLGGVP
jgi:hypothetical protein